LDQAPEKKPPDPRGTAPAVVKASAPELPKGGGAIRGIGEKFSASSVTGTGSMQIPIATTPGRNGFHPELSIEYNSGSGNGLFGLGWHLSVPQITRKTDKQLPQYLDADESDTFLISGAEDLVPALDAGGRRVEGNRGGEAYLRYRPRIEGMFARIERRTTADGDVYWASVTPNNITHVYGRSAAARIADPADPRRVFSWLLERSEDALGNVIAYVYRPEDLTGVAATPAERHRLAGVTPVANAYLQRIRYGNAVPGDESSSVFDVVFDYGDHDVGAPGLAPSPAAAWPVRLDPFSNYRAGFDMRTYRLCHRVLMFHTFSGTDLGDMPCLVSSTRFDYDEDPALTKLRRVEHAGYVRATPGGPYESLALPPLELGYVPVTIQDEVRALDHGEAGDLPGGIDGHRDQWIDLDGEGIPGVLSDDGGSLSYRRNIGGGALAPPQVLITRPAIASQGLAGQQLLDLGGDGVLDLVEFGGSAPGYHERLAPLPGAPDGDWEMFRAFDNRPQIPFDDPNLHFLDLDGDGLDDILIVRDEVFVWYPSLGKGGFGPPRTFVRPWDEEAGPAVVFAAGDHTIFLADLSGDGLRDLARVENGRVCYWPNLGHGRFGAMVTMAAPPTFDAPEQFDPKRILFADVDGSGTVDLLYNGQTGVRFWFNQAGNGWGPTQALYGLPPADSSVSLTAVDLLGTGTACLAWSTPLPTGGDQIRFVDLLGGVKPHLLASIDNNLGATTRIQYAPSTKFYLADRAAGSPWRTRLPFPVHVVERVETYDDVRGVRFVSEYRYAEGYFDGDEREFRGFGFVEQRDTESDPVLPGVGLFADRPPPVNGELPQPPVVTSTWYHTGAWLDDAPTPSALRNLLPLGLPSAESRGAYRALKGMVLRQEVRTEDGTELAGEPYSVTEHTYEVRRLQPSQGEAVAVFATFPRETLETRTERSPDDPRVQHALTIEVDEAGHVRRAVSVAYPRRETAANSAEIRPEQRVLLATLTETSLANVLDETDWYRHGVALESRNYELVGLALAPQAARFTFEEIAAAADAAVAIAYDGVPAAGPSKRLVEQSRVLYYDSDHLPAQLPFGAIDRRAIGYETYGLAFTPSLIASLYGGRVTDAILVEGGYVPFDGNWWVPSGHSLPDPTRFFSPVEFHDPFGNPPTIVTYDKWLLAAVSVTDARANTTGAELDYRTMAPRLVTDPNGCQSSVATDALGRVTAIWQMGNPARSEGDRPPAEPTAKFDYAFFDAGTGRPSVVHQAARETHNDPTTKWLHTYTYGDGGGREVMRKVQAEPAPEAPTVPRWIGTGRAVFDNKGNPIRRYEPFFSATSDYDTDEALAKVGVASLLHYDPLSRLILTERPDGAIARVAFTPWRSESWDENDTLGDPGNLWLSRKQASSKPEERRAATLALEHANTPTVTHLDTLGRACSVIADNKTEKIETRTTFDVEGNPLVVWDALGRACLTRTFSILGQACVSVSIDAGTKRTLVDVAGQPLRHWGLIDNGHERAVRAAYDQLHRPIEVRVKVGDGAEILAEKTIWGEDAPVDPAANRRARIYQTFHGAGVMTSDGYDFEGHLRASSQRLCADYKATPDWGSSPSPALEDETFTSASEHDALGRVTRSTSPDGSITWPIYNEASLLDRVEVQLRGAAERTTFVASIDYDAHGRRTRVVYGASPAATTVYGYDELTFRLQTLKTTRTTGSLQDLAYTYDPVGNIAQISDADQAPVWWGGQVTDGTALYWYEPVYRLARADAREHPGGFGSPRTDVDIPIAPLPHPNDGQKLIQYSEVYDYDLVGNIKSISHGPPNGAAAWVSPMRYDASSNRLLATMVDGDDAKQPETWHGLYAYDAFGNMTSMPHLARIDWDWKDRMQRADKGGGGAVYFTYDASGERARKVWEHGALVEERIYLGGYEIYRRRNNGSLELERETLHVMDGVKRIALVETKTVDVDVPSLTPKPTTRFQLGNHLGSVSLEIDEVGSIISYEEYHPYGTSAYRAFGAVEVSAQRYRYTGKERDEETELYYHGARYYAPWLGRWLSADPAGMVDGVNLFAYVRLNPIALHDPSGRESVAEMMKKIRKEYQYKQEREATRHEEGRLTPDEVGDANVTCPEPDYVPTVPEHITAERNRIEAGRVKRAAAAAEAAKNPAPDAEERFQIAKNAAWNSYVDHTTQALTMMPVVGPIVPLVMPVIGDSLRAPEPSASPTNFGDRQRREVYDHAQTTIAVGEAALSVVPVGGILEGASLTANRLSGMARVGMARGELFLASRGMLSPPMAPAEEVAAKIFLREPLGVEQHVPFQMTALNPQTGPTFSKLYFNDMAPMWQEHAFGQLGFPAETPELKSILNTDNVGTLRYMSPEQVNALSYPLRTVDPPGPVDPLGKTFSPYSNTQKP
jgi:RHS repeat-associated protein